MSSPPVEPPATRWQTLALVAITVIATTALVLAVVALRRDERPGPTLVKSGNVVVTSKLTSFNRPVRFTRGTDGDVYRVVDNKSGKVGKRPERTIDSMDLRCHGGTIEITWYVGNLEPTVPQTGIHLSVRLDGAQLATLLKGSTDGVWNDAPASIHTVTQCPAGSHKLEAHIDKLAGGWGIPYADPENTVQRGFIVRETLAKRAPRESDQTGSS